jgi:hypothetical protein
VLEELGDRKPNGSLNYRREFESNYWPVEP